MPTETQHLQLQVDLIDDASAGLASLQRQINQLAGGPGSSQLNNLTKSSKELQEQLKLVAEEAQRFSNASAALHRSLAFGASLVGGLSLGLYNVGKQMNEFAQDALKLNAQAQTLGVLPGYFQSMMKQLSSFMTPEQAEQNITNFGIKLQEMAKTGSGALAEFIHAGGGGAAVVQFGEQLVGLGKEGKLREALILAVRTLKSSAKDEFGRETPETARSVTALEGFLGLNAAIKNAPDDFDLKEPTADEIKLGSQSVELGRQQQQAWNELVQKMEEFERSFAVAILPTFTAMNEYLRGSAEAWGTWLGEEIKKTIKDVNDLVGDIKEIGRVLKEFGEMFSKFFQLGSGGTPPPTGAPQDAITYVDPNKYFGGGYGQGGPHVDRGMAGLSPVFVEKKLNQDAQNTKELTELNRYLMELLDRTTGKSKSDPSTLRFNQPSAPVGTGSTSVIPHSARIGKMRFDAYADQLRDPAVREKLFRYVQAETGSQGPEAQQAFMEETLNRGLARPGKGGPSITGTLTGSYYPKDTHDRAGGAWTLDEDTRNKYAPMLEDVLSGSNLIAFGTGNAAVKMKPGESFKEGPFGKGGFETYRSPGKVPESFGWEALDKKWSLSQLTKEGTGTDVRTTIDEVAGASFAGGYGGGMTASGSLNVEVSAPKDTTVEAEGSGIFNKTNVERSTPPAELHPQRAN